MKKRKTTNLLTVLFILLIFAILLNLTGPLITGSWLSEITGRQVAPFGAITLTIEETEGIDRINEPVTSGVPFEEGVLTNKDNVRLFDGVTELPLQTNVTSKWPDGSIKWLLLDFQADVLANTSKTLTLKYNQGFKLSSSEITVIEDALAITVDTRTALFKIAKDKFNLFDSVNMAGVEYVSPSSDAVIIDSTSAEVTYPQADPNNQGAAELYTVVANDNALTEDWTLTFSNVSLNSSSGEWIVTFNLAGSVIGDDGTFTVLSRPYDNERFANTTTSNSGRITIPGYDTAGSVRFFSPSGFYNLKAGDKFYFSTIAKGSQALSDEVSSIEVEEQGPLRSVVKVKGWLRVPDSQGGIPKRYLEYTARYQFYAGKSFAKVFFTLENGGRFGYNINAPKANENKNFDELYLDLNLGLGNLNQLSLSGNNVLNFDPALDYSLYQYHEVRSQSNESQNFFYGINKAGTVNRYTGRVEGDVVVSSPTNGVATSIKHFWQQYPAGIGYSNNSLKLELWHSGGSRPLQLSNGFDSLGNSKWLFPRDFVYNWPYPDQNEWYKITFLDVTPGSEKVRVEKSIASATSGYTLLIDNVDIANKLSDGTWVYDLGGDGKLDLVFDKYITYAAGDYLVIKIFGDYLFEGGRQKTHELFFYFYDAQDLSPQNKVSAFHKPLIAITDPAHIEETKAVIIEAKGAHTIPSGVYMDPNNQVNDLNFAVSRYEKFVSSYVNDADADLRYGKPATIFGSRETRHSGSSYDIDWYGLIDFGMLPWVPHDGPSGSQLHYDWPYVLSLQYLRSGDTKYFELASEQAKHSYDIDTYHTDRDDLFANHGRLWEEGREHGYFYSMTANNFQPGPYGQANAPSHHWIQGLYLHYFLTGDKRSLEAADEILSWLDYLWFTDKKVDKQKDFVDGAIRVPGWSIDSYVHKYRQSGDVSYLDKALDIFHNSLLYTELNEGKRGYSSGGDPYAIPDDPDNYMGGVGLSYIFIPMVNLYMESQDEDVRDFILRMADSWVDYAIKGGNYDANGNYQPTFEHMMDGTPAYSGVPYVSEIGNVNPMIIDGLAYAYYLTGNEKYLNKVRQVFRDNYAYGVPWQLEDAPYIVPWTDLLNKPSGSGYRSDGYSFGARSITKDMNRLIRAQNFYLNLEMHPRQDNIHPDAIADLTASPGNSAGSVKLTFTAPGDDGASGTATGYIVKYFDKPIVEDIDYFAVDGRDFFAMSEVRFVQAENTADDEITPQTAGSTETITITGLDGGKTYYFAVKAIDDENNLGGIPNIANSTALGNTEVWGENIISNYPGTGIDTMLLPGSSRWNNYETNPEIWIHAGYDRIGLFYFNISNLPSNTIISRAELKLYPLSVCCGFTGDLFAYRVVDPNNLGNAYTYGWERTGVAYAGRSCSGTPCIEWTIGVDNPLSAKAGPLDTKYLGSIEWIEWNITDAVQGWISGAYKNQGVFIVGNGTAFASSEYTNASVRPMLEITYAVGACGDGNCDLSETCSTCEIDCGICPITTSTTTTTTLPTTTTTTIPTTTTTSTTTTTVTLPVNKTCFELSGDICGINEKCFDMIIRTSDTDNCCTISCAAYPNFTEFDGRTTNFTAITDFRNVWNSILEITDYGIIEFKDKYLDFSDLDLDSYLAINNNLVAMNTDKLSKLNTSATITLYNLTLINPRIMADGVECPASICQIVSYTGGNLTFTVAHFTNYYAEESPSGGGTGTGGGAGAGGGGGGGGRRITICTENWQCTEWSECINSLNRRTCTDLNSCGTTLLKPIERKACEVKIVVTETTTLPEEELVQEVKNSWFERFLDSLKRFIFYLFSLF